jgi:hypothetical protein
MTVTVTDEIRWIDGVETRVVETLETQGDELIEICRNYLAVSRKTNDVVCFGQDVDIYLGGQVVAHDGSWRAGHGAAQVGLKMPGRPQLHYQELAPRVAVTSVEVLDLGVTVLTRAGEFHDCLHTVETTPLLRIHQWYAPGVGLVRRDTLTLVKYGKFATK